MARSSYLWVVLPPGGGKPLAGFTVKHELESFLDGHGRDVEIFRIRDGQTRKADWMKYELVEKLDPVTLQPVRDPSS